MKFILPILIFNLFILEGCDRRPILSEPCVIISHDEWQAIGGAEPGTTPVFSLLGKIVLPDDGYDPIYFQEEFKLSDGTRMLEIELKFRAPAHQQNHKLTVYPINPTEVKVSYNTEGIYPRVRVTCGGKALWESEVIYGL